MVARYNADVIQTVEMHGSDTGQWVSYEDYQALEEWTDELETLRSELESEIRELKHKLSK